MAEQTNTNLLIDIAQDFYINQLTIADISTKYQVSRYMISKYLDEALAQNIVSISIRSPFARNQELERQLAAVNPGHHFYVLANAEQSNNDADRFYSFAAQTVQNLINPLKIIGLSWGDTVYNVIEHFKPTVKEQLIFTQFMGENGKYNSLAGSMRMVQKAANKYNSHYSTLNAPLYIINDQVRQLLSLEPAIQPTLTTARQMDLILTTLGTIESLESIPSWQESLVALFPNLNRKEVAGFLYGRPFNHAGQFLINPIADKTFGLAIDSILQVPIRVAVVNNKFKSHALAAALRGNFLTDLVLDEPTATKILAIHN